MDSSYLFSGTHVQLPFLCGPGCPSKDETAHSSHPTSISKHENGPTNMGKGQHDEGCSSVAVPLSQVSRADIQYQPSQRFWEKELCSYQVLYTMCILDFEEYRGAGEAMTFRGLKVHLVVKGGGSSLKMICQFTFWIPWSPGVENRADCALQCLECRVMVYGYHLVPFFRSFLIRVSILTSLKLPRRSTDIYVFEKGPKGQQIFRNMDALEQ